MADNIRATPRNELLGLLSDAYQWMQSPERTQQMQGFAGLLGTTGLPQTVERMAYGEPLTNIGRANVPLLKPETADALMTVAPFAPKGMKMIRATEGMPVGMSIKPINLNKGIYKPELTMEEMLKVKDIPTVDRVRQSIDLVGEKEFEKMVNAQYKKYKPSDVDQEAMLVESVTLNILGKAQRSPYPQQAALDLAQQRAALPIEQGGLGLPANNTPEMRAAAMGFDFNTTRFHGSDQNIYAFDPAKFGKNDQGWYGRGVTTDTDPEIASAYANYNESPSGQVIYPLVSRGKYMQWPEGQQPFSTTRDSIQGTKDIKNLGYQGTQITNDRDLYGSTPQFGTEQVTFDPANIRSRFAAFDPFRKDVATATAMGVALPDLLATELPEEELKRSQSSGLLFP